MIRYRRTRLDGEQGETAPFPRAFREPKLDAMIPNRRMIFGRVREQDPDRRIPKSGNGSVVVENRRLPSEIDRRAKKTPRETGGAQLEQTRKKAAERIRGSFAKGESGASRAGPRFSRPRGTQEDDPRHLK
jgi:hypothetical protein